MRVEVALLSPPFAHYRVVLRVAAFFATHSDYFINLRRSEKTKRVSSSKINYSFSNSSNVKFLIDVQRRNKIFFRFLATSVCQSIPFLNMITRPYNFPRHTRVMFRKLPRIIVLRILRRTHESFREFN